MTTSGIDSSTTKQGFISIDEVTMPTLPEIAHSAGWSSPAVMLAVSAAVGVILVYLSHKKLSSLKKNRIEQTGRVQVLQWRWLDLRLGKTPCEHWMVGFVRC
jgi:hypothetical protein